MTDCIKILLPTLIVLAALSAVATAQAIPPPPPAPPLPPGQSPPPPPLPPPPGSSATPSIPGAYVITAIPTSIKSGIQTDVTFTVFYDNQPVRDVPVVIFGYGSQGITDGNGTVTLSVKAQSLCSPETDCDKIRVSATTNGHWGETELTVIHPPTDKIEQILIDIATYIIMIFVLIQTPPLLFLEIVLIPFFLAKRYLPRIDDMYGNFFDDNFTIALIPYIIFILIFRDMFIYTLYPKWAILSLDFPVLGILVDLVSYALPVFIIVLSVLLTKSIASKLSLQKWRVLFPVGGVVLSVISFALLAHIIPGLIYLKLRPEIILVVIGGAVGLTFLIYGISRHFSISLLTNRLNATIVGVYILNMLSVYAWLEMLWGYPLESLIPALIPAFIENGGYNWIYLSLPILWILNARFINSGNFRNLLKLIILYVGLAPILRIVLSI